VRGLRGLLTGAIALIALEVLTSERGSRYTSGLLKTPGNWAKRFLDPTVPAIKDPNERPQRPGSGGGPLAGGFLSRQGASAGGQGGQGASTRYPSPFARPAGLGAIGGD
jgi:hypothetical protein